MNTAHNWTKFMGGRSYGSTALRARGLGSMHSTLHVDLTEDPIRTSSYDFHLDCGLRQTKGSENAVPEKGPDAGSK